MSANDISHLYRSFVDGKSKITISEKLLVTLVDEPYSTKKHSLDILNDVMDITKTTLPRSSALTRFE
jgi:hypothetical protein